MSRIEREIPHLALGEGGTSRTEGWLAQKKCDVGRMLFCPSEYLVELLDPGRFRRGSSSFGIGISFRVFVPSTYRPYGLGDPTVPLAISSALWFVHRRVGLLPFSNKSHPLFELGLSFRVLFSSS